MLTSLRRAEDRHQAGSPPGPPCASRLAAPPPREVAGAETSPRSRARHPTSLAAIKQDGLAIAGKRKGGIHYASPNGPRPPGCSGEQGGSVRGAAPRQAAALPTTLLLSARRPCVCGWRQVGQRRPSRETGAGREMGSAAWGVSAAERISGDKRGGFAVRAA